MEAILLEMNLIRSLKPKYNIQNKDDKRPLFIYITNDELPRIKTSRTEIAGTGEFIGPFPSAVKLKEIMKALRRIFPYCSCSTKRKKSCLFVDLGLCPNPMVLKSKAEKLAYKRNITRLKWFLKGQINYVLKLLQKNMLQASLKQEYEKAQYIKNQIDSIQNLLSNQHKIGQYLTNQSLSADLAKSRLKSLSTFLQIKNLDRIEGYDVSNLGGENATAAMIVFEKGLANTSAYRQFKIRNLKTPNDPAMIYEALIRRLKHPEWPYPNLILVDGGKTQVKAGFKALAQSNLQIPLIGLAKKWEQIVIPQEDSFKIITPPLDSPFLILLQAIRDEAHRFTTTHHKKLRQRQLINAKIKYY